MIIVRKFFSSNPYEETKRQQRNRKAVGKAIISSGALLGGGLLAKRDIDTFKSRANSIYDFASSDDIDRLGKIRGKADLLYLKGHQEKYREALKNIDKTKKHLGEATERFKKRAGKLIPKVAANGAVIGAAVGGSVGAGLYYGLVRGKIKKGNEDLNRGLEEKRERLAGKQKEV
jgi:hypothetical protein